MSLSRISRDKWEYFYFLCWYAQTQARKVSLRPADALYLQMRALHPPQEEGGLRGRDSFCSAVLVAPCGTPGIRGVAPFLWSSPSPFETCCFFWTPSSLFSCLRPGAAKPVLPLFLRRYISIRRLVITLFTFFFSRVLFTKINSNSQGQQWLKLPFRLTKWPPPKYILSQYCVCSVPFYHSLENLFHKPTSFLHCFGKREVKFRTVFCINSEDLNSPWVLSIFQNMLRMQK